MHGEASSQILLYRNSALVQQERQGATYASLLADVYMHVHAVLKLAAGDAVRVSVFHSRGQPIQLRGGSAADTSLAVSLVQRTS